MTQDALLLTVYLFGVSVVGAMLSIIFVLPLFLRRHGWGVERDRKCICGKDITTPPFHGALYHTSTMGSMFCGDACNRDHYGKLTAHFEEVDTKIKECIERERTAAARHKLADDLKKAADTVLQESKQRDARAQMYLHETRTLLQKIEKLQHRRR